MIDDDVASLTGGLRSNDALGGDNLSCERSLVLPNIDRDSALVVVWLSLKEILGTDGSAGPRKKEDKTLVYVVLLIQGVHTSRHADLEASEIIVVHIIWTNFTSKNLQSEKVAPISISPEGRLSNGGEGRGRSQQSGNAKSGLHFGSKSCGLEDDDLALREELTCSTKHAQTLRYYARHPSY